MSSTRPSLLLLLLLLAAGARCATAAPLAEDVCRALQAEYVALLAGGIEDTLAVGPDAADLGPDEFERVIAFLRLEAQVRFRCPSLAAADETETGIPLPQRRPDPPSGTGGSVAR